MARNPTVEDLRAGFPRTTVECTGQGVDGDHCCYRQGVECEHLIRDYGDRRFACGLLVKYGTWEAANKSSEYKPIGEAWEGGGLPFNYCQQFSPIFCCRKDLNPGFANDHQAWVAGWGN